MISKQEFVLAISHLQAYFKEQEKLQAALDVICPTSTGVVEFGDEFVEHYIWLLSQAICDKGQWVSWFVYECDFGNKPMSAYIDEKEIVVDSAEKLYEVVLL